MNHDYDEEVAKNTERRSRRNPRLKHGDAGAAQQSSAGTGRSDRQEKAIWEQRRRESEQQAAQALDVMGDSAVHPLKATVPAGGSSAGSGSVKTSRTSTGSTKTDRASAGNGTVRAGSTRRSSAGDGSSLDASLGAGPGIRRQLEAQAAKRRKRRRMIAMIIAECFALVFIFGYAYVARLAGMIQRPSDFNIKEVQTNELNVDTVETMKGYWTIAIFGVDARDKAINKGTNADVNIICNINRDTGEIKLVSVFRDTYLNISENGSYNKLNQAYFLGGPEQAVQALNRNLDLDINDYMTFNWKAVADAINILGGVDIELSKAEFYYINSFITETVKATGVGSTQLTHAGMNHLDGVQAVAYGRLRLMDTDYARTERQRKVIAQAFEKAKKADFKTLNVLIGTVFPQVSTSIWVDDLVSNARNVSKFHLGETTGFPQARGDANMGKKGAVVVPQTLESNVIKLHEFLFGDEDYTPSQTVKNISAKIAADTGMYKEGQYVERVNTDGGVIQQPKATKAATAEEDDETETTKATVETDEDGNPVDEEDEGPGASRGSRPDVTETDEDGNVIERETDEDGNFLETDEDGNLLETESRHPSQTDEDMTNATRPTAANPGTVTRPGSTSPAETTADDNRTTVKVPGGTHGATGNTGSAAPTAAGSGTGTGTGNSVSPTPGAASGTTTTPGTGSGTGVSDGPGSSGSGSTTTAPTAANTPTSAANTPTTAAKPTAPGSSGTGISAGPGSGNSSSTSGTVAAPGQ